MRQGILIGGNWIVDHVKVVDVYPDQDKLANILSESSCNGGSAYNVTKALAKLKADFPISGVGLVGEDEGGDKVIIDLKNHGVNTDQVQKTDKASTSYTDVMSVRKTGRRTFFHQRGANAFLDIEHFDLSKSDAKLMHLGYLLLLDKLDIIEPDGMTRAAKLLKAAREQGIQTSVDIVSERSDRFHDVVIPALPYIDYLFVNEFEAAMIAQYATVDWRGRLHVGDCYHAARKILSLGVNKWVILHFPEGVIAISKDGQEVYQPSVIVPEDKIAGCSGAGDAFAGGTLLGIHNGWDMERSLQLGVCAAAASLSEPTSSEGILPAEDCLKLGEAYGFKKKLKVK
ncbi:carbohydrate kinase family protein [Mucilaginibacter myungsuensis]|uniref:Carbohydrate kinase PfkB domain-containing protein n=1 Tax=Mucilaginibacter myungsuensis TaxID=649104 RepID=A0A929KVR7_9SPHI|nr:PfkB family carbohydrate kinase [Mucilaginibacter myungsuensis]MBE9660788.1 hypothetical protein [Mucilaginibacter myungsuensis]MDN3600834.1 PfkB family carbohydrate kinase [Mucilaginibacter myungsuensis]